MGLRLKKLNFAFSLLSFAISGFAQNPNEFKNIQQIKSFVKEVNEKDLIDGLRTWVNCCKPNKMVGTTGHQQAVEFLHNKLKSFSFKNQTKIFVQEFSPDIDWAIKLYQKDFNDKIEGQIPKVHPEYIKWDRFTKFMVEHFNQHRSSKGKNVVIDIVGSEQPKDVLIIGAHFDTTANDKTTLSQLPRETQLPGADDNGTGVNLALKLLEKISSLQIPKTIRVVFFDFEEVGFLGSRSFVEEQLKPSLSKGENIIGLVNLEMLGFDSKLFDKNKKLKNMKAYIRSPNTNGHGQDQMLASLLMDAGKKVAPGIHFELMANSFDRSDHIHFWEAGIPAIVFTQDWENDFNHKGYHSANDFVETLNFETYHLAFQYVSGAVLNWLYLAK